MRLDKLEREVKMLRRRSDERDSVEVNLSTIKDYDEEIDDLKSELRYLRETLLPMQEKIERSTLKLQVLEGERNSISCPMREFRSGNGIISYLTRTCGGNVYDKGLVAISSKSCCDDSWVPVKNVADMSTTLYFESKDEPGQWLCWDFGDLRIKPTAYTISSYAPKSWVLEGSLEGQVWTEIDRQIDNCEFKVWPTRASSFDVANPTECRYLRFRQIAKTHFSDDILNVHAFEVFGALLQ
jgi:hypothetical protein